MISQFHLIAWSRVKGAELVAICDIDAAKAKARATAFGIPAVHENLGSVLANEAVDAIDVATPLESHEALVRQAADHGAHVLCQKPLTPSLASAEALIADVRARIRLMVHDNWRFRPYYRQIARWIGEGRIGPVQQCLMSALSSGLVADASGSRPALLREPSLRTSSHLAIGTLLIHHLDVLRFLLGELSVVDARARREVDEVVAETFATILLEGANNTPVVLTGNMAVPGIATPIQDEFQLIGTKASVVLRGGTLQIFDGAPETYDFDQETVYQAAFDGAMQHFVDCLRSGTEFETSATDNLRTLRLVEDALSKVRAVASSS